VAGKKAVIYITAENTDLRLSFTGTANFKTLKQPMETQICVFVDPSTTFQSYIGIGGAITDAAAETFAKLSKKNQQDLLAAYFSKENGIGYTIARTNINSCDFSSDMYTYIKDGDKLLQSFSIDHDLKYKIPFIKQATAAAGGKLQLFASPWSPPAFMKDNNNMLQGGKLSANYYQSWASYYTKFIKAYEKEGMPIWGISVQNEPMAKQKWESCIYTAEEERDFIKNYLGPTMQKAGYGNKKIIAWDHNRDLIFQRAQTYFNDPIASKYIWGIGFHWYENWSGGEPMYDNVKRVQESFPNKKLFFTEGCVERYEISRLNDWALGERYGKSMINDSYYYIGHFSKFIQQGAKRISSSASRSKLLTTAFKNSNGKSVVIVMNQDKESVPFFLWVNGEAAELNALPHSILTLIY
ncbi:MAG: glucosylceramidase, partial [Chitinophagaceae bacterium]